MVLFALLCTPVLKSQFPHGKCFIITPLHCPCHIELSPQIADDCCVHSTQSVYCSDDAHRMFSTTLEIERLPLGVKL